MLLPRSLPRRRRLALPGGALEYVLSGDGAPALVLLSGAGVTLEGWGRLYPGIESVGRTLAWNRCGAGASTPARRPQPASAVVASLGELLAALAVPPPYLLVGHSLGGLHAQLFARRHPAQVAGVVLLDATHPGDHEVFEGHESRLARALAQLLSVPQRLLRANLRSEIEWIGQSVREVESAGPFPPVPLAVVSGGREPPTWLVPAEALRRRKARQRELAQLSPLGRQVVARRSGHFPQLTQPELVLQVLREVAQQAREASAGQPLVEHVGGERIEDGGEEALELADRQRVGGAGAERRRADAAQRDDHQRRQPDVAEGTRRQAFDPQPAGHVAGHVGHRDREAERGRGGDGVVDGDVAPGHERHADEAAAGAHQP